MTALTVVRLISVESLSLIMIRSCTCALSRSMDEGRREGCSRSDWPRESVLRELLLRNSLLRSVVRVQLVNTDDSRFAQNQSESPALVSFVRTRNQVHGAQSPGSRLSSVVEKTEANQGQAVNTVKRSTDWATRRPANDPDQTIREG